MAIPADFTIRAASEADITDLSVVLSRAFYDDSFFKWLLPDAHVQREMLPKVFSGQLRHSILPMGAVDLVVDTKSSATLAGALWVPPGRSESTWGLMRQAPALLRPLRGRLRLVIKALSELDKHHPNRPHWYLSTIGVDPLARGRQLGKRLMDHRLAIADSEGIASYLESSAQENLDFYAQFGFELREEVMLPGGPTMWTMLRRPR